MNSIRRSTHTLAPELATEARHLLTTARDRIAQALADDLTALLRVASEINPANPHDFPEGTPSWLVIAALEAAMPDGSVCWDIARAHLTNTTATRLAYTTPQEASQELKEATGGAACYALALALEVNLYEFAGECWAGLERAQAVREVA
ncbi:MAG: hypothetical protein H6943_03655 [Zoogloeaceae bacterium]|nr:hypothetical protein [Zoogloeaceae bacterium]